MPRRTAVDVFPPHEYRRGDDGGCRHCPMPKRNPVHVAPDDPRLARLAEAQEEHRRRTGDSE